MLISDWVKVKWHNRNMIHFISKGYVYTKLGDEFLVKVEDLSKGSEVKLLVKCDYCNKIIEKQNINFLKQKNKIINKDACSKCNSLKQNEIANIKKNKDTYVSLEFIINFLKNINLELTKDNIFKDINKIHINKQLKIQCKIHNNYIQEKTFNNIQSHGIFCSICHVNGVNRSYINLDFAKEIFDLYCCDLLETKYINTRTPMKFKCRIHSDIIQYSILGDIYYEFCGPCRICGNIEKIKQHSGKKSHFWRGGFNGIGKYLRTKIVDWVNDSRKDCNYMCVVTGEKSRDIIVHHLKNFNLIVRETFEELNLETKEKINEYTDEELNLITNKCIELHYKYGLGVCIDRSLHGILHTTYGYTCAPEQFEDFAKKYYNGEFNQ